MQRKITKGQATAAYIVLVRHAGARDTADAREAIATNCWLAEIFLGSAP